MTRGKRSPNRSLAGRICVHLCPSVVTLCMDPALWWLRWSLGVASGWLPGAYRLATNTPQGGLRVASGGFVSDFIILHCRGRDASCPAPPSQIPAGGFPAPGSSSQLALACASRLTPGRRQSSNRWQKLSSRWQGIRCPFFSTMRGGGTWKRASIRLNADQVILWR